MTNTTLLNATLGISLLGLLACSGDPIAGEGLPATGGIGGTGGTSTPGTGGTGGIAIGSNFHVPLAEPKPLDVLVVVDNSASMAPKQAKLAAQFGALIEGIKDPVHKLYPDTRIGFLSTDLGTGQSGTCMPQYGDRGNFVAKRPVDPDCVIDWGAKWLEVRPDGTGNFTGSAAKAASCLAVGVGDSGCGFEQPLQALRFAFRVDQGQGVAVKDFLRDEAQLLIVILSDEDDCSMPLESLMASPNLSQTESWSLRCATRGHRCNGSNLAYPTTSAFSAPLDRCVARVDYCRDTMPANEPTTCSPLANISDIADEIKTYKQEHSNPGVRAEDQIFVAGIFGLPLAGQTEATYAIAKNPNPTPGQPDIFDLQPVCYDPQYPSPEAGGTYSDAVGMAAYPGLRLQAFVDHFPLANRLTASICESSYAGVMTELGARMQSRLLTPCLPAGFSPVDGWQVFLRIPAGANFVETPLPQCAGPTSLDCYFLESNATVCGSANYSIRVSRAIGSEALPVGTTLRFQRG